MNNIVQFKRRTPAPIQNTPPILDYLEFVAVSLTTAETLGALATGLKDANPEESPLFEKLEGRINSIRAYAKSHKELAPLFEEFKNFEQ